MRLHSLLSFFPFLIILVVALAPPFLCPLSVLLSLSQRNSPLHLQLSHVSQFCDIHTQICYFWYYSLGIFNPNRSYWHGWPVLLALQHVRCLKMRELRAVTSLFNMEMLGFKDREMSSSKALQVGPCLLWLILVVTELNEHFENPAWQPTWRDFMFLLVFFSLKGRFVYFDSTGRSTFVG